MTHASLQTLADDELIVHVRRLTARANVALADLLAHLGEVERRGIHRERACASLCTFCVYELRMSEDAAYRRSKAARFVREYPELRDLVAKGELHLTGLLMIGPYLGGERHAELLERTRFRSKREIGRLIAAIDPRPAVPSIVEPLGPEPGRATHQAYCESLAGPVRELPLGQRPEAWMDDQKLAGSNRTESTVDEESVPKPAPDPLPELERPLHYKVQFTATQEYVDLMNEAFALLGHELRQSDLVELELRAMRAFVQQLRKRKRRETDRPRPERLAEGIAADTAPERTLRDPAPERTARKSRRPAPERSSRDPAPERTAQKSRRPAPERTARSSRTPASERTARSSRTPAPERTARESRRPAPERTAQRDPAPERTARKSRIPAPERKSEAAAPSQDVPRNEAPSKGAASKARVKRKRRPRGSGRHFPASVVRSVWARDEGRCAYVDARGHRCRETHGLELHHRHAHALGGPSTLMNLELRCKAHNTLAAERDFGREHMDRVRGVNEPARMEILRGRSRRGSSLSPNDETVADAASQRR